MRDQLGTLYEDENFAALFPKRGWPADSTHVLAAIRTLNRLECVGETLRAVLNTLASIVPEWLREQVPFCQKHM